MSSLCRHEIIRWFTTPTELQRIADEMDRVWGRIQPGEDKTVVRIYGKDEDLHILIDQERMQESRDAR